MPRSVPPTVLSCLFYGSWPSWTAPSRWWRRRLPGRWDSSILPRLGQPPLTFDKAVIAGETGPKSAMGGKRL
jgi:hypothetical protein